MARNAIPARRGSYRNALPVRRGLVKLYRATKKRLHQMGESSSNGRELPIQTQQELPEMGDNSSESNSNGIELAIKIPQDLMPFLLTSRRWCDCCIYKVPRELREINPKAYTLQVVSIGPIHHGDENLKGMHKLKLRYLAEFCRSTNINLSEIRKKIQHKEKQIRRSYLDTFDELEKHEFVEIVLLDSVFVIELLWKSFTRCSDKYILHFPWLRNSIKRDLMLLENQLPYFILEHLYDLSYGSWSKEPFYNLVLSYFRKYTKPPRNETRLRLRNKCDCFSCFYCFWVSRCLSGKDNVPQENGDVIGEQSDKHYHFIDVIRSLLCKNPPRLEPSSFIDNLYNVKALKEAGIKFQVDHEAWPIGVKFEKGVLKMPRLHFEDSTECLFRNIMAYEQYHYPTKAYFSNYIVLLDFLINTEEDVQLLVQSGVVTNWLGHNKVVEELVNSLAKQITETRNCYYNLHLDLKKHCENPWYQKVAFVRSVYFSNIWKGTGTIVALMLLVFTFIQSLNSMIEIFS